MDKYGNLTEEKEIEHALYEQTECRIGRILSIRDCYALSWQEAVCNHPYYYESDDDRNQNTCEMHMFDIYAGKCAECEVMRRYIQKGWNVISGVRFYGKTHDGDAYDMIVERNGIKKKLQVKYCGTSNREFQINESSFKKYYEKNCEIIVAWCNKFDTDNRSDSENISWRNKAGNRIGISYNWNIYKLDMDFINQHSIYSPNTLKLGKKIIAPFDEV